MLPIGGTRRLRTGLAICAGGVLLLFGSPTRPELTAADPAAGGAANIVRVTDDNSLRAALHAAHPSTIIQIAPGRYAARASFGGVHGNEGAPIVIEGSDPRNPPVFTSGKEAWFIRSSRYLVLRNMVVRGQHRNGINIDDSNAPDAPSNHIVLENIHVSDVGGKGNHDGIKLSGIDDFVVRNCDVTGWGGQAIDMVGCHRGLIEGCTFRGKEGFAQHSGPQAKGGSSQIVFRNCKFVNAGARAVNLGGSTGPQFLRPKDVKYEARDLTVEGCTFVGSEAAIAFVGVDGATVRYNTIYHPGKWVLRILQETTTAGFAPCRNGIFERNLVVFRSTDIRDTMNIGPYTQPETFTFKDNFWYCEDRPQNSRPDLPTPETGSVIGTDPKLKSPAQEDFTPQQNDAAQYGATAWKPAAS